MDDFIHCVIMVLAGGVGGAKDAVGWRATTSGWKEEISGGKITEGSR
jgi:hypothetical protein